jgi:parallel beta-helix repeat protein
MGAKFNRQDVVLGALPVGTRAVEDVFNEIAASWNLPNEPFDWDVLPPGTTGQVLTVNADTSLGWSTPTVSQVTGAAPLASPAFTGTPTGDASALTVKSTGSTTAVSLASRYAQVFNVRDYGAKGDGVTNDAVAIQAAITAAAGVGPVYLPSGTYLVNNSCKLPSHSRIYGDGDTSIITPGPSFLSSGRPAPLEATGSTFSNIVIEHLNVNGNVTNAAGAHNISLHASTTLSNIIVRDLTSCNAGSTGVLIECDTTGSDVLVDNVEASNNTNDGVEICSIGLISNCTVVNCHCNNNGRSGIDLASNCNQIVVSNNQCIGNALFGIYTDGGQTPMNFSCIISSNIVCGASGATGIAATFTRYTQILNNDISLCTEGIALVNSTDCLIQGNTIYQNSVRGINCDVSGKYVVDPPALVARDTNGALYRIVDTSLAAFMTPSRVSIIGNRILDNTSDGIWIKNGQYWLIMGNDFQNTASPGVQTQPIYTKYATAPTFPAWASGTVYATGALVSDGGVYYQALSGHTAASANEPGAGSVAILSGFNAWTSGTAYTAGTLVYVGLTIYQCSTNHTSSSSTKPGSGASWTADWNQQYWVASLVQPWATGTVYAVGAATNDGSAFYVCTAAHTSGATTEPGVGASWTSYWALQTVTLDSFIFSHNFSSGHTSSNAITWAGTNGQILMQQGTIAPISSPGAGASSEQFGAGATTGANADSTAIGNSATTATSGATSAVAIGYQASALASNSTAIGSGASCDSTSSYSTAIGSSAACTSANNIAIGRGASATGNPSMAFGYRATAGANTLAFGGCLTSASWLTNVNFAGSPTGINLNLQGAVAAFDAATHTYGVIAAGFNNNVDATWSGNLFLYAGDHTGTNRLGVQIQSNGSAALVGFFGATPVIKPTAAVDTTTTAAGSGTNVFTNTTFPGATGSGSTAYTVSDIVTALKALGLLTA